MTKKQIEKRLEEKEELLRKLSYHLQSLSAMCLEVDQLILLDRLGDELSQKSGK